MPNVLIPTPRGQMPAWLAVPPATASAPGVVVLHDVFGMSQDHRNQANWLAEAGFLAVAPDLYYKGGRLVCIRHVIRDMMARAGDAFDDVEASRSWLHDQPGCNRRIGVVGFCMGGGFALLLACGHGFSAASVNYGGPLPEDADDFLNAACPVVGSYGGQARWEQGVADQLASALQRALVPHDVKEYPDAGHSFMNNHRGYGFLKVLRFKAVGYNEAAAIDTRRRIIAFFRLHLAQQA
ncbi:MAG: dienelactone hydrolase family protein [Terracidiphilus sp.]